ncbi:MAG: tRNA pseudouridine(55) synthase TruB [Gemmatimonadaceae bacterium]
MTTPPRGEEKTTDSSGAETSRAEGLLLVDKPEGMTSHDVVQRVRRVYGERSIGHLGTLDPFATGLLVLLIGRVTRLANFLDTEPKVYLATIRFGVETDTDDVTGTVLRSAEPPVEAVVQKAIESLTGQLSQIPPAYSAKSVDGTRAYQAARRGEPLDLKPADVTVHSWEILELGPEFLQARVICSGGTYIRALARDLGRLAASAAHLAALRRTRVGAFDVTDASRLEDLENRPARLRPLRVVADA